MPENIISEAHPESRSVFISYAKDDIETAQALRSALEHEGIRTDDPLSTVKAGDNWLAAISAAIERADMAIFLVSPSSVSSDWVETEAAIAVGRLLAGGGGRVIPVLLGDVELPFVLKDFQGIRFDKSGSPNHIANLIARLPSGTSDSSDELWRSTKFLRIALDAEKYAYRVKYIAEDMERVHRGMWLAEILIGIVFAISLTAIFLEHSRLVSGVLSSVTTLLAATMVVSGRRIFSERRIMRRNRNEVDD